MVLVIQVSIRVTQTAEDSAQILYEAEKEKCLMEKNAISFSFLIINSLKY